MLFTEDSLASRSAWLVSKKDGATIDIYGLNFRGWSEKLTHFGSSLKTYLESCQLPRTMFAGIWSVSATASGFGIMRLYQSERITGACESSLSGVEILPTPRASHGIASPLRDPKKIGDHRGRLEDYVAIYPTPRCCSGKRSSGLNRSEIYAMFKQRPDGRAYPKNAALNPDWVLSLMHFPTGWMDVGSEESQG